MHHETGEKGTFYSGEKWTKQIGVDIWYEAQSFVPIALSVPASIRDTAGAPSAYGGSR